MIEPTLVVLAAGMGSRFGGLKQTAGFGPGGETLLDYSVFDALRAGFGGVVFVIRRDFEDAFRREVMVRFERKLPVSLAFQDVNDLPESLMGRATAMRSAELPRLKPWGTGHATLAARRLVDAPFGVINADDFYGRESFESLATFLRQPDLAAARARACLVAFTLRQTLSAHGRVARGICRTTGDGLLVSVAEKTDLWPVDSGAENRPASDAIERFTGDEPVSLNTWGFTPDIFAPLESLFEDFLSHAKRGPEAEFYLPHAVNTLIQQGRLQCQVLPTSARWFGVTYREDAEPVRAALAALHAQGDYPERLWEQG